MIMKLSIFCIRRFSLSKSCCFTESHHLRRIEPIKMAYSIYDSKNEQSENKTPLIIMHGLFGSKSNWNSLSKAINNQTGRKVITVDARNHGESPHSDEFSYYHLVKDVSYLLEILNVPKACLLGHSMGGRAMMLFSLLHPENVDNLIVVDISHKNPGTEMSGMRKYFGAMKAVSVNPKLTLSEGRKEANEQLSSSIQDLDVQQFLLTNLIKKDNKFFWRLNINGLEKAFASEISNFPNISGVFTGPTLFIGGSKSSYLRIEDHTDIMKMFPTTTFHYLDAGHWLHAEKPNEFLKLVHDFLSK